MTRLYTLDCRFFASIDTQEKAYILGFLSADGSVHKNGSGITVAIHEKDQGLLEEIKRCMGSNAPIRLRRNIHGFGTHPLAWLTLSSVHMVHDLAALGVTPNKSLTLQYAPLDPLWERHYIRGLFDGDGSICKTSFNFAGTSHVLHGIRAAIATQLGIEWLRIKPHGAICLLPGYRRDRAILHWFYQDSTIYLHRKYALFLTHWPRIQGAPRYPDRKGSNHINARVTEAMVRDMRMLHYEHGYSFQALALRYDITSAQVGNICRYQAWTHVPSVTPYEHVSGHAQGERHHKAKLTVADVQTIRQLHDGGVSYVALAAQFGVSDNQIGLICKRRAWAHVP